MKVIISADLRVVTTQEEFDADQKIWDEIAKEDLRQRAEILGWDFLEESFDPEEYRLLKPASIRMRVSVAGCEACLMSSTERNRRTLQTRLGPCNLLVNFYNQVAWTPKPNKPTLVCRASLRLPSQRRSASSPTTSSQV